MPVPETCRHSRGWQAPRPPPPDLNRKHWLERWRVANTQPDCTQLVVASEDDSTLSVLRAGELRALRMCARSPRHDGTRGLDAIRPTLFLYALPTSDQQRHEQCHARHVQSLQVNDRMRRRMTAGSARLGSRPRGTIFTPQKPAPTGWHYEGSVHASELVWKALAPLRSQRLSAGAYPSLCHLYAGLPVEPSEMSPRTPGREDSGVSKTRLLQLVFETTLQMRPVEIKGTSIFDLSRSRRAGSAA